MKAILLNVITLMVIGGIVRCYCNKYIEYYSSTYSLQTLHNIERNLIATYRQYMQRQQEHIAYYRKFLLNLKEEHAKAQYHIEDYLSDPVNAFKLIKRLTLVWNEITATIEKTHQALNASLVQIKQNVQWPNVIDLNGAINGLMRIQNVYKFNQFDLAKGIINKIDYGSALSWFDCYQIAVQSYFNRNYTISHEWFEVTLQQMQTEKELNAETLSTFRNEIFEYLAILNSKFGFYAKANYYLKELSQHQSEDSMAEFERYLQTMPQHTDISISKQKNNELKWFANYTRLCRGERVVDAQQYKLKCHLINRNNPHFMLAPLKIEELSLDPEIFLYHQMLNDEQIANLLEQADGQMVRSYYQRKGDDYFRTSQQAWLRYNTPVTRMIYKLVSHVTGLDLHNSEIMQVANYGIGGHFNAHCDYLGEKYRTDYWIGDRLASVMFFLSNVTVGGNTVFTLLNLPIRPLKGSMLVWWNMHKSLDQDLRVIHAGCPIAMGSKWIGNIWIHSGYQEFRRPCELQRDNYKSFNLDLC